MNSKSSMTTLSGLATARGFAVGPVFIYRGGGRLTIPEYVVRQGDEQSELLRLKRAVNDTKRDIGGLISALSERAGSADVRIFESHLMLVEDEVLYGEEERLILEERLNAEAAVRKAMGAARSQFARMNDPYMRERVRDIDDVERRLLGALIGFSGTPHFELKEPAIVVADDLTPSETINLPRNRVLGFAMNGGSTTSHVALLARALGIPAVSGLGDITAQVHPGEIILLDGTNGAVTLNPDAATIREFNDLVERQLEQNEQATVGESAGTLRDGGEVPIYANIHPGVPVACVRQFGARGIGLYRSEYLWINRELEPTEEEQFIAYRASVLFASRLPDGASVTIRLLDIGGDKLVKGISQKEANPFLGNRSIRYLLTHRDTMRTQLRAILRASAFGKVRILVPMVSCVEELRETAVVLDEVRRGLDRENIPFDHGVELGAMIEVPSAALNADAIARYVRFFSIGTNDLVQYTMAADRGNKSVAGLYQPLNPSVVSLVRMTIDAARRNGIGVGVCGESAADPVIGTYWAALGVDSLSMSAAYIPVISKLLLRLSRADLDEYAGIPGSLPVGVTADEVYSACHRWLASKIPDLSEILL